MARTVQPWVTGQSSAAHFRPCPEASSSGPFPSAVQDLFKGFARHLSHLLAQKLSPGRSVKEEAQSLIKQFFHNRARCESEADWHGLCGPQR